ncbi:unnamed protein product [Lupinus luteus]|uniref:Uncharacterized protein n=1 Tax=Lupinus luteus TaxID=3873 RepID=A0AAV1XYF0_LUPLU
MSERYSCPYLRRALKSLMGVLLSTSFTFILERDLSRWRLGWNIKLLSIAYGVCNLHNFLVGMLSS